MSDNSPDNMPNTPSDAAPASFSGQICKYNQQSLIWDLAKGAGGLVLVSLPLFIAQPVPWLLLLLLTLEAIFLFFIIRIGVRFLSEYQITDKALVWAKPVKKAIQWDDLTKLKLRYYATKKSGENGWMHLQLNGKGNSINLDSQLEGFDIILEKAAAAATKKQLPLDPITIDNLNASGIVTSVDRVEI